MKTLKRIQAARKKIAQVLNLVHEVREEKQKLDDFIKQIGIKSTDPLIQQIREIKNQETVYSKDKAKINVLFLEAKRKALVEQMERANVQLEDKDSFSEQVLEELTNRITEAVKEYNKQSD